MPRAKTPGGNPNRVDLNTAPSGKSYGARQDTERRLQAVPVTPAGGGAPPPMGGPASPTDAALQHDFQPVGLSAPTNRPMEPVTAGMPTGAGPGPEGITMPPSPGPHPDVSLFAKWLPMLELLSAQPGSSMETRQFLRRLRSQMPVE